MDEASWYRDILDRMDEMVCRFGPDGTLLYVNQAYCDTFGLRAEEVIGTSYTPVVYPDDLDTVTSDVAKMSAEQPDVEIVNRVFRGDGEVIWTRWHNRGFFDERGVLLEIQATGRDITPTFQMEERLRASHYRLHFLADASDALAASLDYEVTLGRVTRLAVPALADSCTVTLTHPSGQLERVSVVHVDRELERDLAAQSQRDAATLPQAYRELVARVLAGEIIHVADADPAHLEQYQIDEESTSLLRRQQIRGYLLVPMVARGRTVGVMSLVSSREHSNRRWDEEDIALARELARRAAVAVDNARLYHELEAEHARKDQFLATLAHELRNPMAALSAAIETLQEPDIPAEVRDKALEIAARQVRQQSRMVDDLLDVSRLTRGRVELRRRPLSLRRALAEIVDGQRPLAARKQITLEITAPQEEIVIEADGARLQQIVGNLLDNAIKFTPRRGRVEVELRRGERSIWIEVRDQGPGIPEPMRDQVFDLFVQGPVSHETPSSGLGIGLTIARELVRLHGGRIEAKERAEGGTAFTVCLPLQGAELTRSGQGDVREGRTGPLDVLVVDDNPDTADTLGMLLRGWGHRVRVAYGGPEAIEAAEEQDFRLVLLDIGMPRMDGYETARALRELGLRDTHLVALTGYSQPHDVEAARAAGFDRHLTKPASPKVLREILASARRRAAGG